MPLFPHLIYMNEEEVREEMKSIYCIEGYSQHKLSMLKSMLKEQRQWIYGIHNQIRMAPTMPSLLTDYMNMLQQQGYDTHILSKKAVDIKAKTTDNIFSVNTPERIRCWKYTYAWERFVTIIYLCPVILTPDCIIEPPSVDEEQDQHNLMMKGIYSGIVADMNFDWIYDWSYQGNMLNPGEGCTSIRFEGIQESGRTDDAGSGSCTSMIIGLVGFLILWCIPLILMYLSFRILCYVSFILGTACQFIVGVIRTIDV